MFFVIFFLLFSVPFLNPKPRKPLNPKPYTLVHVEKQPQLEVEDTFGSGGSDIHFNSSDNNNNNYNYCKIVIIMIILIQIITSHSVFWEIPPWYAGV